MRLLLLSIYVFLFMSSCSLHKEDSTDVLDGDVYSYYENGNIKEHRHYRKGKLNGLEYSYDSLGNIEKIVQNILIYDSISEFWDPTNDSIDEDKKISIINSYWTYLSDGSIDTANSCFFKCYIKDTLSLSDSALFQLKIVAPYLPIDSCVVYRFLFQTTDNTDTILIRNINIPFFDYSFKPQQVGWNKCYIIMKERNICTNEFVEHYGCFPYYVKE